MQWIGYIAVQSVSAAMHNIVLGADASNAFAEAPAPVAPLYMKLDTQFHAWWRSKGRDPIPDGYGVRVHKAIQGHPESHDYGLCS